MHSASTHTYTRHPFIHALSFHSHMLSGGTAHTTAATTASIEQQQQQQWRRQCAWHRVVGRAMCLASGGREGGVCGIKR